jgi:RimJ/RimL family protein N-acetyltransferase
MVDIIQVNEKNKQLVLKTLVSDVVRHVFAVYDLQKDPQHTRTYAAFMNGNLQGYILIYAATDVPSVILECEDNVAEKLLEHAPLNNFIVHAPPNLLPAIQKRYPDAKHYVEDWMLVPRGKAKFFRSQLVRRLHTEEDASKLANLLMSRKDRPVSMLKRYADWISKMPVYGVFREDKLVSYAGSFLQLPQVWLIGGVYTDAEHRNKGYATLAASAITEEALKTADAAVLFVRSDNHPALRAYQRIGYAKMGEKVWVDVGTGLKP